MSFHVTSRNVDVKSDGTLHGDLERADGEYVYAELNLNDVLGNENGHFLWGGVSFTESADVDTIHFQFEGDDNVPILRARLRSEEGEWFDRDVNLSERIVNENGSFVFQ
ncbi:hypothetical protein BBP40_005226 [Aspergillus hancockii]|nr:hypothetical protein BBP40_005226 [Aspergillus hancockii]